MWRWVTRGLILTFVAALIAPALLAQQGFTGDVDLPDPGVPHSGVVLVRGWALDQLEISKVELWVDGTFQHEAIIYLPRVDVVEAFPGWPGIQNARPGFITGFLASRFSNGPHTVELRVLTSDGTVRVLGQRTIQIDNSINQSPFGFIDAPDGLGVYNVSGAFPVSGWAADTDGIDRIEVLIDNLIMQTAIYGEQRPDVGATFPDFPAALFSGFVANIDSTRIVNGVHNLMVRAVDVTGHARTIAFRQVQIINNDNFLKPFGFVDEPQRDATIYGTGCAPADPPPFVWPPVRTGQHITPVRGWALDLGTRVDVGRVGYVELLIDGSRWLSTDDCGVINGNFANCYGMPRHDVARYYPTFPDSPRSGFLFTLDVGALMKLGVRPGHHRISVRVGDRDGTFAEIPNRDGIPVWFQCADPTFDRPAAGHIDFPTAFDYIGGDATFRGWAVDQDGIAAVEILVDGNVIGQALYGFPRPDVGAHFPHITGSGLSGWAFTMDTSTLSNARHRLTVRSVDTRGNRVELGSVDFYVTNGPQSSGPPTDDHQ